MYTRQERPLSDIEWQQLETELRGCADTLGLCVAGVVLMAAFDSILLALPVLVWLAVAPFNVCGLICWGFGLIPINSWLVQSILGVRDTLRERRQIRACLADGQALVECVVAREVAVLNCSAASWYLVAVGDDAVLVSVPCQVPVSWPPQPADPKGGLHAAACFERVTTRLFGRVLSVEQVGQSSLGILPAVWLRNLIPDTGEQSALIGYLQSGLVLRGTVRDLAALLRHALAAPLDSATGLEEPWGLLQGRLEERFGLELGPGMLAWQRPATAGELADLVSQHLPEDACRPVTVVAPWFYRLRAALLARLGLPRRAVRPNTRLEEIVPRRRRRQLWRELERQLGRPMPLFAPRPLPGCTLFSWSFSLVAMCLYALLNVAMLDPYAELHGFAESSWYGAVRLCLFGPTVLLAGALAVVVSVSWVRRRWICPDFDARHATVGEAARFLAEQEVPAPTVRWTDEEVWLAVRRIVADVRGGRPMDVTWQTPVVDRGAP